MIGIIYHFQYTNEDLVLLYEFNHHVARITYTGLENRNLDFPFRVMAHAEGRRIGISPLFSSKVTQRQTREKKRPENRNINSKLHTSNKKNLGVEIGKRGWGAWKRQTAGAFYLLREETALSEGMVWEGAARWDELAIGTVAQTRAGSSF